jgi:hypothetical protein
MKKAIFSRAVMVFSAVFLLSPTLLAADTIDLQGAIVTTDGTPLCAMVLASGKFMFSCNPIGEFALKDLPAETDGTINLQVFAKGFIPYFANLSAFGFQNIEMNRCNDSSSHSIVGSWLYNRSALSDSAILTIIDSENYMFAVDGEPDDGGGRGMERGTYTWDSVTGAFTATALSGTAGDWGISFLNTMTVTVTGNSLDLIDSVEGLMTFTRVQ